MSSCKQGKWKMNRENRRESRSEERREKEMRERPGNQEDKDPRKMEE